MSSHREAPAISKDPVADSTDLYAFVSPDDPSSVTILANYVPLQAPQGGPNFFEFGDDVLYQILIDNDADGTPEIIYGFQFTTAVQNPNTFLYNTGPISSLTDPNWNRRQTYTVTKSNGTDQPKVLATGLTSPPVNIGPRSTPNYAALAQAAVHTLSSGETVFAGQRADGFYVDLGSVFDLAALRPFQNLHLIPTPAAPGVNGVGGLNVHSIAIKIPKTMLTSDGSNPTNAMSATSVIGVWTSASRQASTMRGSSTPGVEVETGPWVQVSRLGNPLINEVIIPMGSKDAWNANPANAESKFLAQYQHPEVSTLLPVLYPGVFPNLAKLTAPRADIVAVLTTGIPPGIVPGFQNYTGSTMADQLRLNMAIAPTAKPNNYGLLGGDAAGYPNGRRVQDDVATIEIRALAGLTYALIDSTYKPDAAAGLVTDFTTTDPTVVPVPMGSPFLSTFPYLGVPYDGYGAPHNSTTLEARVADERGSQRFQGARAELPA
jgi:hypothetical protein